MVKPVTPPPPVEPVPPPTALVDAPVPPQPITADDTVEWKPHKCKRLLLASAQVSEEDAGRGQTLDIKLHAIEKTRKSDGVCDTRHRGSLEASLLAMPAPKVSHAAAKDPAAPLEHLDRVRATLALSPAEEKLLSTNGFVVPERLAYDDFTRAYYDIHRGELPVYVTVDSILHAVYASHDELVGALEREQLVDRLDATLGELHCGLAAAAKRYPKHIADDLDLYLTVARSLLANEDVPSELGHVDALARPLVGAIRDASTNTTVELFGRVRALDTTMFTPRGHYTSDLEPYFRAAMWLSRLEFNLVSRDNRSSHPGNIPDPSETPREAVVALALADLVERTGAARDLAAIEKAWSKLAGERIDVGVAELKKLRPRAGIKSLHSPDAATRLRTAIGDSHQRTINIHPMANVASYPVIATLIGPRVTPDTAPLSTLTNERGPAMQAAEVAFFLGHDRALAYTDPTIKDRLHTAREELEHAKLTDDLYSAWLEGIRALAHKPAGVLPSFMDGTAFADLRMASALTAYGQLRHNHVLFEVQVYDQGGCEIPDGYVEPAIETYKALAKYAQRGRKVFEELAPKAAGRAYFARLEQLMNVLVALSREELAGRPLSPTARRFLAMIVEQRPARAWNYNGSFPLATWDGWYIDLFPNIDTSIKEASFMADYATFDRNGASGVHYIGAHGPRLGVFVVDVGGKPRAMVGPVASGFQHTGDLAKRLTDDDADDIAGSAPWAKSYVAPAPAPPDFGVEILMKRPTPPRQMRLRDAPPVDTLRIESAKGLGTITVELLDHHFQKMSSLAVDVGAGRTDTKLPQQAQPIEAVRIIAGDFATRIDLSLEGYASHTFGTYVRPTK